MKYQSIVKIVEAEQWDSKRDGQIDFPEEDPRHKVVASLDGETYTMPSFTNEEYIAVVQDGAYIVRDADGNHYALHPEFFENTYQAAKGKNA